MNHEPMPAQGPVDVPVGPWVAVKCSKPQAGGDWFVARKLLTGHGFSHFEQMRDCDGLLQQFPTEAQARRAIAEAEGRPWFATDAEAEDAIAHASGGSDDGCLRGDLQPYLMPREWI